jgi:hypothetical protein
LCREEPELNRHVFHKWELLSETINISLKVAPTVYVVAPEKRFCPAIEAEMPGMTKTLITLC